MGRPRDCHPRQQRHRTDPQVTVSGAAVADHPPSDNAVRHAMNVPRSPTNRAMLRQVFRTHTYFAAFVTVLAGTAAADPKSPQCWDCRQRLAMGLPAVNAQEDPSYEQGLTPGSVLPSLALVLRPIVGRLCRPFFRERPKSGSQLIILKSLGKPTRASSPGAQFSSGSIVRRWRSCFHYRRGVTGQKLVWNLLSAHVFLPQQSPRPRASSRPSPRSQRQSPTLASIPKASASSSTFL